MITSELFGTAPCGTPVHRYTLNGPEICVRIMDYGATVLGIDVPDIPGNVRDVVLGFDKLEDYFDTVSYTHLGAAAPRIQFGHQQCRLLVFCIFSIADCIKRPGCSFWPLCTPAWAVQKTEYSATQVPPVLLQLSNIAVSYTHLDVYKRQADESEDSLTYSNGVIEKIVAMATREVPHVLGMKGNLMHFVQEQFGAENLTKGVTVEVTDDNRVVVNISVIIEYGAYAPAIFDDVKALSLIHI